MKKLFFLVVAVWFIAFVVFAKDKGVVLTWTQTRLDADLIGWNIYYSETPGGPYQFGEFVGFDSAKEEYRFEGSLSIDWKEEG